ncbi:FAD-dependent oxidoreductase [Rhizobium leguminosarum]|uniref:FAD-dependent oxidoreductase n=1 Tax=Rhizobium leguminosarum TaxID=384 RepID=UPI0014410C52
MLSKEVAVVGAEIVGLSVAYALVRIGASATVIDRYANCGNASSGNAGVDPGSLEERSRMVLDPLRPLGGTPGACVSVASMDGRLRARRPF